MATVELCMIVKNGAPGLERCLHSVRGIVDRILIGDTGSTDGTLAIAERYDVEMCAVPWTEDYAAARNVVLSRARCEWVLVLDADEMLAPGAGDRVRGLVQQQGVAAWDLTRLNYVDSLDTRCHGRQAVPNTGLLVEASAYPAWFETVHTRLFRRDARIRFERPVHETVAYAVDRAALPRRACDLQIHHFGYVEDAPQDRDAKAAYYHQLGLRSLTEQGGADARAYLESGMSLLDYAKDAAAAERLLKVAAQREPGNSLAWLYLGLCALRLGRLDEAQGYLERARVLAPDNSLVFGALGDVHFQQHRYAQAAEAFKKAAGLGDHTRLTEAKLGAALVQSGHAAAGLARIERACAAEPEGIELQRILATSAVAAGALALACGAAARCVASAAPLAFDYLLGASVYLEVACPQQAEAVASQGLARYPGDPALEKVLAAALAGAQAAR